MKKVIGYIFIGTPLVIASTFASVMILVGERMNDICHNLDQAISPYFLDRKKK
jgi:hypothetical protein